MHVIYNLSEGLVAAGGKPSEGMLNTLQVSVGQATRRCAGRRCRPGRAQWHDPVPRSRHSERTDIATPLLPTGSSAPSPAAGGCSPGCPAVASATAAGRAAGVVRSSPWRSWRQPWCEWSLRQRTGGGRRLPHRRQRPAYELRTDRRPRGGAGRDAPADHCDRRRTGSVVVCREHAFGVVVYLMSCTPGALISAVVLAVAWQSETDCRFVQNRVVGVVGRRVSMAGVDCCRRRDVRAWRRRSGRSGVGPASRVVLVGTPSRCGHPGR